MGPPGHPMSKQKLEHRKRMLGLVGCNQNAICIFLFFGSDRYTSLLFIHLLYTSVFLQQSRSRLPLHGDIVGSSLPCRPFMTVLYPICAVLPCPRGTLDKMDAHNGRYLIYSIRPLLRLDLRASQL